MSGLEPETRVSGGIFRQDLYHNGGEWLYGVFRTGQGQRLTGFVHAEDHYWTQIGSFPGVGSFAPGHEVYKSISLGE